MPTAAVNGIELFYDVTGDDDGAPLLLIMGLGAQMIAWDDDFCAALADRGFKVVRYDNRDVGLSTKLDGEASANAEMLAAALGGGAIDAPYLLSDMAADAVGLLDHLGIDAAHVVGASMGGMIAQTVAIEHPERVLSLTSIMSTTGDPSVGAPTGEAMTALLTPRPTDREAAIEGGVEATRIIGSPEHFDEERARARAAAAYDRCFNPAGFGRQLLAVVASGDRTERLRSIDVPTLVIHGDKDPLVTPTGGEATAAAVPGAELLVLEGMGHDLPPAYWGPVVEAITKLASRAMPAAG
jgi:pimeloyl-ACP methyl ester carboxylesterase